MPYPPVMPSAVDVTNSTAMLDTHPLAHNLTADALAAMPWGEAAYVEKVTDQLAVTSGSFLTGLTLTWTVPTGGRKYLITAKIDLKSTVNADVVQLALCDAAGSQKMATLTTAAISTENGLMLAIRESLAAGSHTRKLKLDRFGSGVVDMKASAGIPAFIHVLDIGPP